MSIQGNNLLDHDEFALYHPLAMEWCNVIEQYTVRTGEAPYWFTEMADVGLLLAAAWRSGWVGVTEFQTEKRKEDKEVHGRGDLWLSNDDIQVYLEAKSAMHSGDDLEGFVEKVGKRIADAKNDCAATRANSKTTASCKYVAATFISVKFQITPDIDLEKLVSSFLSTVAGSKLGKYAYAWSFPLDADAKYVTRKAIDDAYLYPGAFLFLDRG
ncbi:hypothetical protein RYZ26_10080 [Terasakiella sp. A23]|uniref:hypothetical protein n=1 Tax=Terasakiella sp. FCG-A23 TaxID=3080561 RepID=UPI0029550C36|nr:hypothetical protein [Terasakiella sp. A23]MDV7339942.1 hypothetical protein [Terasakiella sp. A23]